MSALDEIVKQKLFRDFTGDDYKHCVFCRANIEAEEGHKGDCIQVKAAAELAALREQLTMRTLENVKGQSHVDELNETISALRAQAAADKARIERLVEFVRSIENYMGFITDRNACDVHHAAATARALLAELEKS